MQRSGAVASRNDRKPWNRQLRSSLTVGAHADFVFATAGCSDRAQVLRRTAVRQIRCQAFLEKCADLVYINVNIVGLTHTEFQSVTDSTISP